MEPKKITDLISVMGQIRPADIADIRKAGFRSIIVNRPDGEEPEQPTFEEIRAAAEAAGMEARYLPVESGKVSDAHAEAFARAIEVLPKSVLAFCRTGTRSATLWAISQADGPSPTQGPLALPST